MTFLGFMSMSMIGVLVSVIVEKASGATGCEGIPSCNWLFYALIGGVCGAVSLPVLVLRRMNQPAKDAGAPTPKS
jgi:hypothetical protein